MENKEIKVSRNSVKSHFKTSKESNEMHPSILELMAQPYYIDMWKSRNMIHSLGSLWL